MVHKTTTTIYLFFLMNTSAIWAESGEGGLFPFRTMLAELPLCRGLAHKAGERAAVWLSCQGSGLQVLVLLQWAGRAFSQHGG